MAAFLLESIWAISKGLWLSVLVTIIGSMFTGGIVGIIYWFIFVLRGNFMFYNKVVKGKQTLF